MEKLDDLLTDEQVLMEFKQTKIILIFEFIAMFVAIVALMIIFFTLTAIPSWVIIIPLIMGIIIGFFIFLDWKMTIFRITDKRVEMRSGIIGFVREEIYMADIQSIDTKHHFVGILFNFGDVLIEAAGHNTITLSKVENTKLIAKKIADLAIEQQHKSREDYTSLSQF